MVSLINFGFHSKSRRHFLGQLVDAVRNICANIKYLIVRFRNIDRFCNYRSNIVDITKCSFLFPVSKNGHGLVLHNLIHKNTNDITVFITNVLFFTINIVRAKNNIGQPKHSLG